MYQVHRDPDVYEHFRSADRFQDHFLMHSPLRSHHNTRQEFCDPTRAAWKYTSHGYFQAIANTYWKTVREQISSSLTSRLPWRDLPAVSF